MSDHERRGHNRAKAAIAVAAAAAGLVGGMAVERANRPRPQPASVVPQALTGQQAAQALRNLKDGQTVTLQGVIPGQFKFSGLSNITINAKPGTTVQGPGTSGYTFWFSRCRQVAVDGPKLTGGQLGCYVMGGSGFTFKNCDFSGNRQSGFLTDGVSAGPLSGLSLIGCKANDQRDEHGIYVSDGTDTVLIQDCQLAGNGHGDREVDLQFNAEDSGKWIRKVTLRNVQVGSGKKHATGMTIKKVDGLTASGLRIRGQSTGVIVASGSKNIDLGRPDIQADRKVLLQGAAAPRGL